MSSVDELPFGAAAPSSRRLIGSPQVLEAAWVIAVACGIVVSSFFDLLDFGDLTVRTGTAPLRVFAVGLPVVASAVAIGAATLRRPTFAAASTGLIVPAIGLIGLVGSSFFFSDNVGLVDVGAALSVGAATVGAFMAARWFVYHPDDVDTEEPRPTPMLRSAMAAVAAVGGGVATAEWVAARDGFVWSDLVGLAFALLSPLVIVVAAFTRTGASFALGAACAGAHVIAALIAARDTNADAFVDDIYSLWAGPFGMAALALAAAIGIAGQFVQADDEPAAVDDGAEPWRWIPE